MFDSWGLLCKTLCSVAVDPAVHVPVLAVHLPSSVAGAPNPASPLLALTKKVLAAHCGSEPEVTAIHAGLECGVLGAVLGGDVDMVSFGPTILGAH